MQTNEKLIAISNINHFLIVLYSKMISALGRPFDLGMLYDRRSDKLILGKTLWSPDHLNAARNIIPRPFTNSEVFMENAIEDKASALNIEASLKLSFLSGLVNVEGAAKYLNDTKTSKRQSRVVLKYETTTELKQLTMEHLGTGKIQYPEVFETDIATDVVVGILYGAKAFMVFDKELSKDESLKEVHGNMEVLVKSLPGISVDGRGSVEITEEHKKNTENMQCKMYGDFRTNESPTNYEDAVRIYKQLPSLIGENGENAVPIQVYLCPLSNIDSKCQRMVREISADLVSKTATMQEHLQSVIAECNDLLREEVCVLFPRLKKQLNSFMNNVELYKVVFQKKILSLLPKIRGGGAEEIELAKFIEQKETSPFSCSIVERWLEDKKHEIKRLQGIIQSLGETPVVNPEAVENEVNDPTNEFMVCCTFKIACEEDDQILKMNSYINGDVPNEGSTKNTFRADEKSTHKKVRQTLRHFITLKSVNEENNSVKFLATDNPLSRDYGGNTGAFLYFYEEGELENEDFCSYPKPNNLRGIEAGESTLQLSWDDSAGNNVMSYKVQYKDEASTDTWSSVEVKSSGDSQQTATLTGLQPATNYIIRVCAVRKIIVSEYSEVFSATTKPASPPGKPQLSEVTSDSITIDFEKPQLLGKDVQIINYKVEWSSDTSWTTRNVQHTEDSTTTFTLKNLDPLMSYFFKVTANCGDAGESNSSPSSDAFSTSAPKSTFQPVKVLGLCKLIEPPKDNKPAVYALPLTLVQEDGVRQLRKYEIHLGGEKDCSQLSNTPNKVIMMVGSTGSGKTTTVNALINHVLGVKWEDSFRLKMIHEDSSNQGTENIGKQIWSQTQFVTCYTLPHLKGFKVPYTLTIVDTPGFGDTRGIKQDEKITEQIRTFFNTSGVGGIDHIDAICFLAQAGIPRLTSTQRYVFDRILSMFGKDIKKNISVLFTFADGEEPQALSSLREAGILDSEENFFKFNNSALFVDNAKHNNFGQMFWSMGITSFEKFLNSLNEMESKSLVLTKEVMQERAQLEVRLSGLQEKINCGINTLSRLQQQQSIFSQHAVEINANKNFKYTVEDEIRVQVPLETGRYVTNCTTCNYTCHYPCGIPRSEDKARCSAMTNGRCDECPNRCASSRHINDAYRMETKRVKVLKEYDSKKTLYQKAVQGQTKVEALISQLKGEFESTQEIVLTFVAEMQRGIKRLSEIALKKDALQQVDHLDLLIQSEKMQAKPGFKERVKSLQETRERAEQINKMVKPGYDPWEKYRENEETRVFLQKDNSRQKGIIRRLASAVANTFS
ncbi:uncharacterized protein LOC110055875 isoform X2 [Paramuricea clavata]|uniref:Uncharacterized protein LOC110055875 isoform X2 n=1 Tax=Paramuricea clavata TaxID=317549 RepID=A0A6S7JCE1_PARCT|nr:uncharacterized protein LOC110055875 isoform X2 [Paramuricea clavata]